MSTVAMPQWLCRSGYVAVTMLCHSGYVVVAMLCHSGYVAVALLCSSYAVPLVAMLCCSSYVVVLCYVAVAILRGQWLCRSGYAVSQWLCLWLWG